MGTDNISSFKVSNLQVRGYFSKKHIELPSLYTRSNIPLDESQIPTRETALKYNHLADLAEEMTPLLNCSVGLLIGYDCTQALMPREVISRSENEPYAIKTDLGWSIVGGVSYGNLTNVTHRMQVREQPVVTPREILSILEADFKDTEHQSKCHSQEDLKFLSLIESGIHINNEGHLQMPLPFRSRPSLPNNKRQAQKRLNSLKNKLEKNPKFKEDYVTFMDEVIKAGDAEIVDESNDATAWYIPHQGVYHPRKPNKIRVVFDCFAQYLGTSLNDHLLTGPDLTNGLVGVLCRFREHRIAITCDVQKMFHQFHVDKKDREFLCFLWWENGNTKTEPVTYQMKVHLFGAASSPGCANYGMRYLAHQNEKEMPVGSKFITNNFYVDDGLTSVQDSETAIRIITEARRICEKGKLCLHKFVSNCTELLDILPASEKAINTTEISMVQDDMLQRTLGLQWSVRDDSFFFSGCYEAKDATRRGILSTVSAIYDPLGFLTPFILRGKAILQEMCKKGVGWDDPLPDGLKPKWYKRTADVKNLPEIQIQRCAKPVDFGKIQRTELHHFSDASSHGYGQCSYIRFIGDGKIHCALLVAKARVAPTKIVTIPRLELTAAVISAATSSMLREQLDLTIDDEYFWTDSKIVLGYINNEAKRFHVFVANRVQHIRNTTNPEQWFYVENGSNPANHASRGKSIMELKDSNWLKGPAFLWQEENVKCQKFMDLVVEDPEVKHTQTLKTCINESESFLNRIERFSSWSTLVAVIARILRLAKRKVSKKPITVGEKQNAAMSLVHVTQQAYFKEEIDTLKMKGNVTSNSQLHHLDPFIDNGVLRVGGRMKNSSTAKEEIHPVILPKQSKVTTLILAHYHTEVKHQGRGLTQNALSI